MEDRERLVLDLGNGKTVIFVMTEFDTDNQIDIDDILRIDYSNILGEVLTFPVIFNRIAILRSQMEEIVRRAKLDLTIFESELRNKKRNMLQTSSDKRVTDIQVETAIHMDASYRKKCELYYRQQRDLDYLDSLYWSAKSKDQKLNILSERITPVDFERDLVADKINGVMIKITQSAIP